MKNALMGRPINVEVQESEELNELHNQAHQVSKEVIYFISDGCFVKIGRTNNLKGRCRMLSTGNPNLLSIVKIIPGGSQLESFLHDKFNTAHVRNEWFKSDNPSLKEYLSSIEQVSLPKKINPKWIESKKELLKQTDYLNQADERALRLQLEKNPTGRDELLITLLMESGMSAREILRLRVCDLKKETCSITSLGLFRLKRRAIPISKKIFNRLLLFAKNIEETDRIFPISYERLYQIWDFFKPGRGINYSLRCLRHTFAMNFVRNNGSPPDFCEIMGWSDLKHSSPYYNTLKVERRTQGKDS